MATVEVTLRVKMPKMRIFLCKVALVPLFVWFTLLGLFGWSDKKEAHLNRVVDRMAKWVSDGVRVRDN